MILIEIRAILHYFQRPNQQLFHFFAFFSSVFRTWKHVFRRLDRLSRFSKVSSAWQTSQLFIGFNETEHYAYYDGIFIL